MIDLYLDKIKPKRLMHVCGYWCYNPRVPHEMAENFEIIYFSVKKFYDTPTSLNNVCIYLYKYTCIYVIFFSYYNGKQIDWRAYEDKNISNYERTQTGKKEIKNGRNAWKGDVQRDREMRNKAEEIK